MARPIRAGMCPLIIQPFVALYLFGGARSERMSGPAASVGGGGRIHTPMLSIDRCAGLPDQRQTRAPDGWVRGCRVGRRGRITVSDEPTAATNGWSATARRRRSLQPTGLRRLPLLLLLPTGRPTAPRASGVDGRQPLRGASIDRSSRSNGCGRSGRDRNASPGLAFARSPPVID